MKKITCLILALFLVFGVMSCTSRKTQPPEGQKQDETQGGGKQEEQKEKLDKKEGKKVAEGYMGALILRDAAGINNFYSTAMKQQAQSFRPVSEPHPNGYTVEDFQDKEGKLEGKAVIFSITTGEPYFSSDESSITIVKEKGSYVIDKIEKSKSTEIIEKEKSLFVKEGGDIKGKEIVKLDDLPQYAVPQGSTPDQKYPVGRDKFGPIAQDPDGKKVAITTLGTYPSIMIAEDEGKKVTPLDIFFEGTPMSIAWSQDGKFLALEMASPGGSRVLNIYDVEKEKKIDDPMRTALKSDKYSINMPYWVSGSELVFNASPVGKLTPDEEKQAGTYKFDVNNISLTRF